MSRQVHVEPAHHDGHGRVRSHTGQEQRRVLQVDPVMDGHEDSQTRNGNEDTDESIHEPMPARIASHGDDHTESKRGDPRRDRSQLGHGRTVSVALDDGGSEVGISVGRHNHAQVHEAAEPDLVVLHDVQGVLEGEFLLRAAVARVRLQTGSDVGAFVFGEPFCLLGEGGEGEEEDDAHDTSQGAFEDEDPAPTEVTAHAAHLADGRGKQTTESAGQGSGGKEESESLLSLGTLIPHSQEVEAAGEHAALEDTQEEAGGDETAVVLHQTLHRGYETEADAADGQPYSRGEALEEKVGRDLEDDVGDEEDGQTGVVLVARETEILHEAVDLGVGDVDSIQEGEQIQDDDEGEEVRIDSAGELALCRVWWTGHMELIVHYASLWIV